MKIESKISGWSITDCKIKIFPHYGGAVVTLKDIDKLSRRSAQWILDNYNLVEFTADDMGCRFGVLMAGDDLAKVSIMEYYPEYEQELSDYFDSIFGDWRKCYLRFGH